MQVNAWSLTGSMGLVWGGRKLTFVGAEPFGETMRNYIVCVLARVIGFVMALALSVAALASVINGLGTSAELMLRQMERFAPSAVTLLPESEYPGMATMITGYLDGTVDMFQYSFRGDGDVQFLAFHDYEQQHMADCRELFVLDRSVLLISVVIACVMIVAAMVMKDARRVTGGFLAGVLLVILAAMAVGIWGLVDFEGLFILFHHLSFDNGLWLLNPATDLLIRLMPTAFFMDYAVKLVIGWGVSLLMMAGASAGMLLAWKHKR